MMYNTKSPEGPSLLVVPQPRVGARTAKLVLTACLLNAKKNRYKRNERVSRHFAAGYSPSLFPSSFFVDDFWAGWDLHAQSTLPSALSPRHFGVRKNHRVVSGPLGRARHR